MKVQGERVLRQETQVSDLLDSSFKVKTEDTFFLCMKLNSQNVLSFPA